MVEPLTRREHEVLVLLGKWLSDKEIAQELVISPRTVKKHASNIYGKLGVNNRMQAVEKAKDLGLL
jgi:LuxR family maltose regulon positive regulatory protein